MLFIALEPAAFADVALPAVVGTSGLAPWNDVEQAPDLGGSVTIEAAQLAVDAYPTFAHLASRWTLRGTPGATRVLAMPIAGPYGPELLPAARQTATVNGQAITPGRFESAWCASSGRHADPDGTCPGDEGLSGLHQTLAVLLRREAYDWWTFPVTFRADGTAELAISYDQLVDGAWHAYGDSGIALGIATARAPHPFTGRAAPTDLLAVPIVDVTWRLHGIDPSALTFYPPPTTRAGDTLVWHATDGSLTGVIALGTELPALDASTPNAPYLPDDLAQVVRLEDYLARMAFAKEPPTPEVWLTLTDALRAASQANDADLSRAALCALNDLHRRVAEGPPSEDRDRTLAFLAPGVEVTETGILAMPSVGGYLDEDDLAGLTGAADLAVTRARTRTALLIAAPAFVALGLGLFVLRRARPA